MPLVSLMATVKTRVLAEVNLAVMVAVPVAPNVLSEVLRAVCTALAKVAGFANVELVDAWIAA